MLGAIFRILEYNIVFDILRIFTFLDGLCSIGLFVLLMIAIAKYDKSKQTNK